MNSYPAQQLKGACIEILRLPETPIGIDSNVGSTLPLLV